MTECERALLLALASRVIGRDMSHWNRILELSELVKAAKPAEPKPSTLDQHQTSGSITLTPVAPSPEAIRDFERRAGRAVNAKEAEPKPSASTLPQRLRSNSYNSPTWNDCDVMREAAHALENKDAEIAAVIRDNDRKMKEIERLNERIKCLKDSDRLNNEAIDRKNRAADRMGDEIAALDRELTALRTPDIEAAAKRLDGMLVCIDLRAFGCGPLNDASKIAVARAILTREPG